MSFINFENFERTEKKNSLLQCLRLLNGDERERESEEHTKGDKNLGDIQQKNDWNDIFMLAVRFS